MITAAGLADALAPALVELVQPGEDRPVLAVELVEPGVPVPIERGDVVVAVGARDVAEVVAVAESARAAAGLVLRRGWADHTDVRALCKDARLPLLAVADDATWSSVLTVLRNALDAATGGPGRSDDRVYGDLFDMADRIGVIIDAPVTIEDATSRVLAYSTGQDDVDQARLSTIVGRRVPRELRDHFRSLGVFRRLTGSDEPFFVPAGADGVRARYVVPVRAGGEWLGSVWAVVDEPVSQSRIPELRGDVTRRPGWLEPGRWRVAALAGPPGLGPDARSELWLGLARRHGWRQPLGADLDGVVHVMLRTDVAGPGGVAWMAEVVAAERRDEPAVGMFLGREVESVEDLARSRAEAAELCERAGDRSDRAVTSVDDAWPDLVLARALTGLEQLPPVSPVTALAGSPEGATMLATLEAVIDYWGEPRRAAQALGVHPNTVRYRTARLADWCDIDLDDPAQRLAVRLEIARLRAAGR